MESSIVTSHQLLKSILSRLRIRDSRTHNPADLSAQGHKRLVGDTVAARFGSKATSSHMRVRGVRVTSRRVGLSSTLTLNDTPCRIRREFIQHTVPDRCARPTLPSPNVPRSPLPAMSSSNSHLTSEFSDLTSLLAASTRTTSCDPSLPSYCPTLPTSLLEGHLVASPFSEDCDLECANAPTDTPSSLANPGGPVLTSAAGDSADAPAYDPSLYYSTVDNTTSDWLHNVGVDEPEHLPLYSPNVAPCLFSHQIAFRVKTSLTGAVMISITVRIYPN